MTPKEMLHYVDHTQLKAFAVWEDIEKLCREAAEYGTASVCIPPCYIKRVKDTFGDQVKICTVVDVYKRQQSQDSHGNVP